MIYKAGKYSYEPTLSWAKFPKGASPHDAAALDVDSQDRVYVATRGTPPIVIFDRDGNVLTAWGEGQFKNPHGIHVGPDGSIYVADTVRHVIMKFNFEGKLLQVLGNMDQRSSTGFTGFVMPDHYDHNSYYARMMKIRDFFKTKTRVAEPFNAPCATFVAHNGEIYVADGYGNCRVHKFSPDGKLILSWGHIGDGPGEFLCVHSVWVDGKGQVWVGDRENYRICLFNTQGKYIRDWKNDLPCPSFVYIDKEERVFITESLTRALSIWNLDGTLIARWYNYEEDGVVPFIAPHYCAVDSRGDIYVSNTPWAMLKEERVNEVITKFVRKS